MNRPDDLIDTGEMYLRCVLELEEEGTVPLRARLAERLGHSIPTVSQTVARMERDGLVTVSARHGVDLTPAGRSAAVRVMRKHRIAECLLADILGLDWSVVHEEACRWEHVISDTAERRVLEILGHPEWSPYGNPIPGLSELGGQDGNGQAAEPPRAPARLATLASAASEAREVTVRRITEPVQSDSELMAGLRRAGLRPGSAVSVSREGDEVRVGTGPGQFVLDKDASSRIFVTVP